MSVHREGVNPSSMDGVPDLRDHNSFLLFEGHISIGNFAADSIIIMTFDFSFIEIYGPSKQSYFHSLIDRHQADKKLTLNTLS